MYRLLRYYTERRLARKLKKRKYLQYYREKTGIFIGFYSQNMPLFMNDAEIYRAGYSIDNLSAYNVRIRDKSCDSKG
jgi:hypothetical protein